MTLRAAAIGAASVVLLGLWWQRSSPRQAASVPQGPSTAFYHCKALTRHEHTCREAPLAALADDGFAVVRGFLTSSLQEQLLNFFHALPRDGNANYAHIREIEQRTTRVLNLDARVVAAFDGVLRRVKEVTGWAVDTFFDNATFFRLESSGQEEVLARSFGRWHQDTEPHFQGGRTDRYLNLYVFLQKDDASLSNVQVVPLLSLRESCGDEFMDRAVVGRCCAPWYSRAEGWHGFTKAPSGAVTIRVGEADGTKTAIGIDLEDAGCTPQMKPGDLLIFRGDVIHRTQPGYQGIRISLNANARMGNDRVDIEAMIRGPLRKMRQVANEWEFYAGFYGVVRAKGSQRATFQELSQVIQEWSPPKCRTLLECFWKWHAALWIHARLVYLNVEAKMFPLY